MTSARPLIIGATGMLGFALHRVLHDHGYPAIGTTRRALAPNSRRCKNLEYVTNVDVEDFDEVLRLLARTSPTVVINATCVLPADANGRDIRKGIAVNSVFPRRLAQAADTLGFHTVHFSTDCVFDGTKGAYSESSLPNAKDLYGMGRLMGETPGARSLVLRTSTIGRGLEPNASLVDWFLAQSGRVSGFRGAIFSGLPVNEIARVVSDILLVRATPLAGLFHLSAAPISKFELLELIRTLWARGDIELLPDDSRAVDRSLDSTRLWNELGYIPPDWRTLLEGMHDFYASLDE